MSGTLIGALSRDLDSDLEDEHAITRLLFTTPHSIDTYAISRVGVAVHAKIIDTNLNIIYKSDVVGGKRDVLSVVVRKGRELAVLDVQVAVSSFSMILLVSCDVTLT